MSSNEATVSSTPVSKGYYVATSLSNNLQVGYDSFVVREDEGGLVVESKHLIFGGNAPVQTARFNLDLDWTPRRLEVTVEDLMTAVVEFGETETSLHASTPQGEQRTSFPVGRRRAYFLMSGALYFPMHIVRRFDFDNPQPQKFDLVPSGLCEVRRGEDLVEDGETFRQLEMRFQIESIEDAAMLVVNRRGDLVRYRTRNQNLLVKLEERE
ncbi:MAG TPA: hypothetical protein VJT82_01415 [Pyrinomonadaceae bacterium]|nr:hypothetical protein [Pyrinomonadaceae bacterium]